MSVQVVKEVVVEAVVEIRMRKSETDCPRCRGVVALNAREECYECINCGYIDCGDDANKGIGKEKVAIRREALSNLNKR